MQPPIAEASTFCRQLAQPNAKANIVRTARTVAVDPRRHPDQLAGAVRARARGSLTDVLGDRLEVVDVTVTVEDTTVSAEVVYRPKPAGETRRVALTLPAAAL